MTSDSGLYFRDMDPRYICTSTEKPLIKTLLHKIFFKQESEKTLMHKIFVKTDKALSRHEF